MNLSKKLAMLVSILVLVGLLILTIVSNSYTKDLLRTREEEESIILGHSILGAIDQELETTKTAVMMIANDPETQRLFAERNRDALFAKYMDSYTLIKNEVAQFQFHLPDSTSFLRLHAPEKYGDSLKDFRITVNEANATGQTIMGLEEGRAGYGLRVVVPVTYNGQGIGTVEFGNSFDDHFLQLMQEEFGGDAYFIYKLDQDSQSEEQTFLAATVEEDIWPVDEAFMTDLNDGQIKYLMTKGSEEGVVLVPFKDFSGQVKGYIKVIKNRADVLAQIQHAQMIMYGIAAAIILAVFILLNLLINELIRKPLNKITDISRKVSKGDFDVEMEFNSKDEISVVGKAFSDTVAVLKAVISDVGSIAEATIEGELDRRGDENKYEGAYAELITEINGLADGLVDRLDAIPFPTILIDPDYNVKFTNKTGAQAMGVAADKVIGHKCYDIFNCSVCNTPECPGKKAIQNKKMETVEATRDKSFYSCHITPFMDHQGQVIGMLEMIVDQTEIKNAQQNSEKAQQEAQEQAKLIEKQMMEAEKQAEIQKQIAEKSDEQANLIQRQMEVTEKQADYQQEEVEKLVRNLEKLAAGDLNLDVYETEYDEDTRSIALIYQEINENLYKSVQAIKSYIQEISESLEQMAEKDFTGGISRKYLGDFVDLKESINHILSQFNQVFSDISKASDEVGSGSQQVAYASQNLAEGSSEQASSIEEISASMTLVADQTKENALNANKANELTVKAKEEARTGNDQMGQMLYAMEEINESSKGIAKIIKVIDDIAFQTNILSLNAAVEAARAGEHGKGFAVVAEEVRVLAARSAQAARETTQLIDTSIEKVDEGNKMAKITAESLEKIVQGATDAVSIVELIAQASNDQATAINEINIGVNQIAEVTQRNTATSEESASASEEMAAQAQSLKELIGEFRLNY